MKNFCSVVVRGPGTRRTFSTFVLEGVVTERLPAKFLTVEQSLHRVEISKLLFHKHLDHLDLDHKLTYATFQSCVHISAPVGFQSAGVWRVDENK